MMLHCEASSITSTSAIRYLQVLSPNVPMIVAITAVASLRSTDQSSEQLQSRCNNAHTWGMHLSSRDSAKIVQLA